MAVEYVKYKNGVRIVLGEGENIESAVSAGFVREEVPDVADPLADVDAESIDDMTSRQRAGVLKKVVRVLKGTVAALAFAVLPAAAELVPASSVLEIGDLRDDDLVLVSTNGVVRLGPGRMLDLDSLDSITVKGKSVLLRAVDDERVYAPTGYGDFRFTADEDEFPGLADALSGVEPNVYEYGDGYVELSVSFEYDGRYLYASSYGAANSLVFDFECYDEWYDDETGYYDHRLVRFSAKREVLGYDVSTPVDTFAHQTDVTSIRTQLNSVQQTLVNGETLRERAGGPREYGTGWGYLRKPVNSDFREWRIRAPRCTVRGMSKVTGYGYANTYYTSDGVEVHNYSVYESPLTMSPMYRYALDLTSTHGKYGTDGVELAHYRIGIVLVSQDPGAGYYLNFDVRNTNRNPRQFTVTPDPTGFDPPEKIKVYDGSGVVEKTVMGRSLNIAPVTSSSTMYLYYPKPTASNTNAVAYTSSYRLRSTFDRIYVSPDAISSGSSFSIKFHVLSGEDGPSGRGNVPYVVKDLMRTYTVTFSFSSTLADYILPEGRVVTDETSGCFYDEALKGTWKISVDNGCFYTELVSDRDWRTDVNWTRDYGEDLH